MIKQQLCYDGTYRHKMEAFVTESLDVVEMCSICKTIYFFKNEEINKENKD